MDDSVILLDDSQNSVEIVEDDVEDGELEDEVEFVPTEEVSQKQVEPAAKSEANETNNSSQVGVIYDISDTGIMSTFPAFRKPPKNKRIP